MPLESATFISQLNPSNPAAGDLKSEGDDQIRLVKSVLQAQFPSLGATAVTATATQINSVTSAAQRSGDTYTGIHNFTGAVLNVPTASASDNDSSVASTAMVQAAILASSGITASLPSQTGNAGKALFTNGTVPSWAEAEAIPERVILTSGTSWVCPAGVTRVKIQGCGGGGSGGKGSGANAACGGGGGGYFEKIITVVPSTSYTYAIGAGGASQSVAGSAGSVGGATTFNDGVTTYTANGGQGGTGADLITNSGAEGGTATNGDINIQGSFGIGVGSASRSIAGASALSGQRLNAGSASSGYGSGGAGTTSGPNSIAGGNGVLILEY